MRLLRAPMAAVAVLLGTACAHGALYAPDKTPEQLFNERWTGRAEDDVLLHYGSPTEAIPLANGNRILSYHREVTQSGSRSSVFQGSGGSRSFSTTTFCDRRFEIDKDTSRVLRAVITGNSCNFDL
jgi:hypothetical protein